MSNTENTRSLQKLQDIIRKEIAFHDLEYQDGQRGFLTNQNHEMTMCSFTVHLNQLSAYTICLGLTCTKNQR